MCNQPSLDTVCDRAERPLHSRARGHESLLDLTGTACRPCSAPEMRSRMRLPSCAPSFCSSKPVWLPRIITSCPKTAKALRVCTPPARREAQGRPSRARLISVADPPPNRGRPDRARRPARRAAASTPLRPAHTVRSARSDLPPPPICLRVVQM
jgi:hypothetical protein